jgi:hypothetical protein
MRPRKTVEEFVRRFRAARLHVLDALLDRLDGLLIVLTFPFEIFGQRFVERIGGRLATPTCKLLELGEPLGRDGRRLHTSKVELP